MQNLGGKGCIGRRRWRGIEAEKHLEKELAKGGESDKMYT